MLVHNVYYNNGGNAQIMHGQIARHYQLPAVSMQSSIYPEVVAGRIPNREITEDDLHPNDKGHELVASVITYALDKIRMAQTDDEEPEFPAPLTQNCYEKAVRLDNRNYEPENYGFVKDTRVQEEVKDCFKNGWAAKEKGSSLTFTVQGSEIAVQFKRCVTQPAPVALAIVDHDEAHAVTLDANFDEDWGDSLTLTPVMVHGANGTHTVEVRLISGDETMPAAFELISVITSENKRRNGMFPKDFVWGVASSAYQVEGTDAKDGRGKISGMSLHARAEYTNTRPQRFAAIICIGTGKILL